MQRIVPLILDVTDRASIAAAVAAAADVTVLVNNARQEGGNPHRRALRSGWYAFGASKAALWSATNSLCIEVAPMGVPVTGVHMGYVDTGMAAHADGPERCCRRSW